MKTKRQRDQEWSFIRRYAKRNEILKKMGMTYEEYLRSGIWATIKLKVLKRRRAGVEFWNRCNSCGAEDVPFQLHHTRYNKIHKPVLSGIVPLCGRCHHLLHKIQFENRIGLGLAKKKAVRAVKKLTQNA